MYRLRDAGAFSLLLFGLGATGCGGSKRVLESISISPNPAFAKNGTIQLVATGTFNLAPLTVSPLPVDWSQTACSGVCNAGDTNAIGPISVSSAGVATCAPGFSGTAVVEAVAPTDPDLPPNTQNVPTVRGVTNITCP